MPLFTPKISSRALLTFALLTLTSTFLLTARCAPLVKKYSQEKEQLLAMPSDGQQVYTSLRENDETNNQPQIVHYIKPSEISHQSEQVQMLTHDAQPEGLVRQEVYYVLKPVDEQPTDANNGVILSHEQSIPSNSAPDTQPQFEAKSNEREYPGEIIYVGQDEDSRRAIVEGHNGQNEYQYANLANLASTSTQDSAIPATILTEVPVRDLPYDVLEKLKRDYGVKVVATRERPGANLVINCDDYSGQESSICSKQSAYTNSYRNSPYTYDEPVVEGHNLSELPEEQARSINHERINTEEKKLNEDQNSANDDQAPNEGFGTRNSPYTRETNQNEQPKHDSENPQHETPQADKERDPSYSETDHHHIGFDEQPDKEA